MSPPVHLLKSRPWDGRTKYPVIQAAASPFCPFARSFQNCMLPLDRARRRLKNGRHPLKTRQPQPHSAGVPVCLAGGGGNNYTYACWLRESAVRESGKGGGGGERELLLLLHATLQKQTVSFSSWRRRTELNSTNSQTGVRFWRKS